MHNLVERIVKQIVDNPDKVEVKQIERGETIILQICTAKEDLHKIIGKGGRVVNALRVIVGAAAGQLGKRAEVEILENKPLDSENR